MSLRAIRVVTACVVIGAVALVPRLMSTMQAEETAVPVYHEPHHRMVFQAGPLRILDGQVPPGDSSLFHTHESPILYITLSGSQMKTDVLGQEGASPAEGRGRGVAPAEGRGGAPPEGRGGAGGRRGAPPNAVAPTVRLGSTTSYIQQPITHRITNVGDRLFHFIAILNESAGSSAMTAEQAGFSGEPELTNNWFRAYRFSVAPGQSTDTHQHRAPVALVQISDGRAIAAGLPAAPGVMKWELNEPSRWAWFDAGDAHDIKNVGDTRVEFFEVEIRRP